MSYDPRIATVSRAEFDELMAIVRAAPDDARPLSDDDRWRRDYQAEQERRRIVGYQQDLFASTAVTHFHRHRPVSTAEQNQASRAE